VFTLHWECATYTARSIIVIKYEKFAARVAEAMKRLGLPPRQAGLDHVFADYRQARFWRRSEVIRGYVESVSLRENGLPDLSVARARLLPRLRERSYHDFLRLRGLPARIPRLDLADNLCVELMYEATRNIAVIDEEQLARWGASFDECYWHALENLRRRSREPFALVAPGVYVGPWRDGSAAARLVLTDLLLSLSVKGLPVAVAPHRDLLFVTGSADYEGLAVLAQLVVASRDHQQLLSTVPMCWTGERWATYLPPPYHPRHQAMKRLHLHAAAREYREQKALLEAAGRRNVIELVVTEDRDTGRPYSMCTVRPDAVPALIPLVDVIAPVDAAPIPWETIAPALAPQGMWPERFELKEFPARRRPSVVP
jgi:uncharacterized protein YtpQ (UPF0354 family)